MAFARRLSRAFVTALNECYETKGSWWRKCTDDPDAFIAIRGNYLNVYVNGGSLLRVGHSPRKGLVCSIHEEYVILRSRRPYIELTSEGAPQVELVRGTAELATYYADIKRRVARFSHAERAGENTIAARMPQVLDMEAAFSWDKGDGGQGRVGRVDLVALGPSGRLVLIEAKLLASPELRDGHCPSVVTQIRTFTDWLRDEREQVLAAYRHVLNLYGQLRGRFFQKRAEALSGTSVLDVHDRPRLLIFGFNQRQKRDELQPLLAGLCRGPERGRPNTNDIVAVGDPRNLTTRTLLRGL